MPPSHVTLANTDQIRKKLYADRPAPKCDLKKGDIVRIPIEKSIFKKGYEKNWSERLYIVTNQKSSFDVCYYTGES